MIDWQKIMRDLSATYSLGELSKLAEISTTALSDIRCGRSKQPTGYSAVRLHQLHSELKQTDKAA